MEDELFTVSIVGIGEVEASSDSDPFVVVAISVSHPQVYDAWVIYRRLFTFFLLFDHLAAAFPQLPTPPHDEADHDSLDVDYVKAVSEELGLWLQSILQYAPLNENSAMRSFLCMEANQPPPNTSISWLTQQHSGRDSEDRGGKAKGRGSGSKSFFSFQQENGDEEDEEEDEEDEEEEEEGDELFFHDVYGPFGELDEEEEDEEGEGRTFFIQEDDFFGFEEEEEEEEDDDEEDSMDSAQKARLYAHQTHASRHHVVSPSYYGYDEHDFDDDEDEEEDEEDEEGLPTLMVGSQFGESIPLEDSILSFHHAHNTHHNDEDDGRRGSRSSRGSRGGAGSRESSVTSNRSFHGMTELHFEYNGSHSNPTSPHLQARHSSHGSRHHIQEDDDDDEDEEEEEEELSLPSSGFKLSATSFTPFTPSTKSSNPGNSSFFSNLAKDDSYEEYTPPHASYPNKNSHQYNSSSSSQFYNFYQSPSSNQHQNQQFVQGGVYSLNNNNGGGGMMVGSLNSDDDNGSFPSFSPSLNQGYNSCSSTGFPHYQSTDDEEGGGGYTSGGHTGGGMLGFGNPYSSPSPKAKANNSYQLIQNFDVIRVIGKGSFGKVYLVREKRRPMRTFAMKVLKKSYIVQRKQVEHTRTERSVLSYVNHPYIVGLNMAFQSKSKLYFILDYCAGGELFFHLGRKGQFSQEVSVFYAAEITSALHCLHGYGIIYRDLKPENVLLDEEGHIRITDFGLSKEGVTDNDSGADSFCGTPEYLAPEILTRTGHGRAVDWWSLGAILYEMLVGSPPFYSNNRQKLFSKIQNSPVVFPPFLSYEARDILEAFLHKNPAHRLGSGPEDAEEVKVHPIFADIDWELLERRELEPPWRPKLANSLDTSQFDAEFTSMPAALTPPSFSQEEGRQALRAHYGDQQPSTMHSSSFYHTSTPTKDTNGSFVMSPYHSTPTNNNLSSSSLGFAYSQNQDQDQDQSLSSSVSGSLFDGFTYTDPNAFLANEANFA